MRKVRKLFKSAVTPIIRAIIVIVVIYGSSPFANQPDSTSEQTIKKETKNSLLALPFFYYSPETKIAGGLMANYINRTWFPKSKPSSITPIIIYTQKNQTAASLNSEIYWDNSNYHFIGSLGYSKFPGEFYGIGTDAIEDDKEEYTPEQYVLEACLQYQFFQRLYFGLGYNFDKFSILKTESDGVLKDKIIIGSEGGVNSIIKAIASYDSRDNIFWPTSGYWGELSYGVSDSYTESDFDYTIITADLRNYRSLSERFVLAGQFRYESVNGDAPFNHLPQIGGDLLMRGYYAGRYTDKNMYVIQTELRFPVWRKLGAAVFCGVGDVASKADEFKSENIKPSYGLGLRYRITDEKVNVRLDLGYGDNSSGFYISFGEAF